MPKTVLLSDPASPEAENLVKALLEKCLYFPYAYHRGVSREKIIRKFLIDEILSRDKTQKVFIAEEQGSVLGFLRLQESPWDSTLMGRPVLKIVSFEVFSSEGTEILEIGRLLVSKCLEELQAYPRHYCLIRIDSLNHHLVIPLLEKGFLLLETLVCYGADLKDIQESLGQFKPLFKVSPLDKSYLSEAGELAADRINPYDRIHMDPTIDQETARVIMKKWVLDGASGFYDSNYKATKGALDVGFMLADSQRDLWQTLDMKLSKLVLSAVSKEGRGAYLSLVVESIKDLQGKGCETIEMTTQIANRAVLRVWQSIGLRFLQGQYTLRKIQD